MTPVIYTPAGAALEYSPLAANLYRGCSHACRYCYAPSVLRMSRDSFAASPMPRQGVLEALSRDAVRARKLGRRGPVLLCFTSDPYQPCEASHRLTRRAIEILAAEGLGVRVLTKNPRLARRDFDLYLKHDVEFGVTLASDSEAYRREWEPSAGTIADRCSALVDARAAGIRTWVSVEPVINPDEALSMMRGLVDVVGVWKVGKLNHDAARERAIDWPAFLSRVLMLLSCKGARYYIKDDLWKHANAELRGRFAKAKLGERARA